MTDVRVATFAELDSRRVYEILRLRVDVFVVEQACAYPELDGRDLEESAVHLWTWDDNGPSAYLRVLDDGDASRIGRVCTRSDVRGQGLAADLVRAALKHSARRAVVLDAQSQLVDWYAHLGFRPAGPEFLEDAIPHTPMRRESTPDA